MPSRGQSLQFHFRLVKKLTIEKLWQNAFFRGFNIFHDHSFDSEELPVDTGRAIVSMLQS